MRRNIVPGLGLALGAGLVVLLGDRLGLELESTALLGVALGGAVGLVPDRSPVARAAGLLGGVLVAWVGYLLRAAVLPDAPSGRAVAATAVVLVCLGVSALTLTRVPLWSLLVGAAGLVGSYETSFTASPSQVLDTSVTGVTTVLLAAGLGFALSVLLGPAIAAERDHERAEEAPDDERPGAHAALADGGVRS